MTVSSKGHNVLQWIKPNPLGRSQWYIERTYSKYPAFHLSAPTSNITTIRKPLIWAPFWQPEGTFLKCQSQHFSHAPSHLLETILTSRKIWRKKSDFFNQRTIRGVRHLEHIIQSSNFKPFHDLVAQYDINCFFSCVKLLIPFKDKK